MARSTIPMGPLLISPRQKISRPTLMTRSDRRYAGLLSAPNRADNERDAYWQRVSRWSTVTEEEFMNREWQKSQLINRFGLPGLLDQMIPQVVPAAHPGHGFIAKEQFIQDVMAGNKAASMPVRLTPHVVSIIDWKNPLQCPIFRQFLHVKSNSLPDVPGMEYDSLAESSDSPITGLVHRYPSKVLFLLTPTCPVHCTYCTRSYAVGDHTSTLNKSSAMATTRTQREAVLQYIREHPEIRDVVLSGGDTYTVNAKRLKELGEALLEIGHVQHIRIATRGLAVDPSRICSPGDDWTQALIDIARLGHRLRKDVALHTHFNHPKEFTWMTQQAANFLHDNHVVVRNQSVLLRGVNDNDQVMSKLLENLSKHNIRPLYVYLPDMVKGTEHHRTSLATAITLEKRLRGTLSGHHLPMFVIDLPGGGGKRDIHSYEEYDRASGISIWTAEGVKPGMRFEYRDPLPRQNDE